MISITCLPVNEKSSEIAFRLRVHRDIVGFSDHSQRDGGNLWSPNPESDSRAAHLCSPVESPDGFARPLFLHPELLREFLLYLLQAVQGSIGVSNTLIAIRVILPFPVYKEPVLVGSGGKIE